MARKLPRLQRVLDAPALFSIAYGEIASSIYFALGIIAFHALGFTPAVLLLTGALFLVVSLSYAEGTAAIRETGGAATFVRIAFNDFWGFVTGWALFLDYLIVIALAALYVPHYAAAALFTNINKPWDVVAGCGVIAAIAAVRLLRNRRLFRFAVVIALIDLATQLLLVILGLALLFSPHALSQGTSLGSNPTWHSIAFALPLAMLAYTGLETVANLSEEVRRPGRDLPRSLFGAIGLVVLLYAAIAVVGLSAFPAGHGTPLGSTWAKAPLMGIVSRLRDHLPDVLGAPLQVFVGTTGALILVTAVATSIAGFGRLAYSLGEHGQLPRVFGRLSRRSVIAPQSIIAAALISIALLITTSAVLSHPVFFLAGLYSFGVLLYQALTGNVPFSGRTPIEIAESQIRADQISPAAIVKGVSDDLDSLCRDLLNPAPAARPGDDEVLTRLGVDRFGTRADERTRKRTDVVIDRARETKALMGEFRAAQRGAVRVVFLNGSPGSGKTTVADHFLTQLRASGQPFIVGGRCHPWESVPLNAIDAIVDSLARSLRRERPPAVDEALGGQSAPPIKSVAVPATPEPVPVPMEEVTASAMEPFASITEEEPVPTQADLDAAWEYSKNHPQEIEQAIREHEDA